jgi:hypothetical protein
MHYALGPNACVVNFAARILVTSKGRVDLWAEVVKVSLLGLIARFGSN